MKMEYFLFSCMDFITSRIPLGRFDKYEMIITLFGMPFYLFFFLYLQQYRFLTAQNRASCPGLFIEFSNRLSRRKHSIAQCYNHEYLDHKLYIRFLKYVPPLLRTVSFRFIHFSKSAFLLI